MLDLFKAVSTKRTQFFCYSSMSYQGTFFGSPRSKVCQISIRGVQPSQRSMDFNLNTQGSGLENCAT